MKRIICIVLSALFILTALCGCDFKLPSFGREVSASDIEEAVEPAAVWEPVETEEEYIALTQEKLGDFINTFTELSGEAERLSQLSSKKKILADVKYTELSGKLTEWCRCADSFTFAPGDAEQAQQAGELLRQLSGVTEEYLGVFPDMLAGSYTGEKTLEEYETEIVDAAVALFEIVNQ